MEFIFEATIPLLEEQIESITSLVIKSGGKFIREDCLEDRPPWVNLIFEFDGIAFWFGIVPTVGNIQRLIIKNNESFEEEFFDFEELGIRQALDKAVQVVRDFADL